MRPVSSRRMQEARRLLWRVAQENVKDFSEATRRAVYERCRYRCENCGAHGVELHHLKARWALTKAEIEYFGDGGGDMNCVALCSTCHAKAHLGEYPHYRTPSWAWIGTTGLDAVSLNEAYGDLEYDRTAGLIRRI